MARLSNLNAQVPAAMPPEANAFYTNAMAGIRQQIKDLVIQGAAATKHRSPNADSLSRRLPGNNKLKGLNDNDIEGITVLIMVQASRDMDAELKIMVLAMSHSNDRKQQPQTGAQTVSVHNVDNKKPSPEELNQMQNLKLSMIMEMKSRLAEEISNVMKKISGTQQNIISHLK
jgi:hypothetical protein